MVRFRNLYSRVGWAGTIQIAAMPVIWAYLIYANWNSVLAPMAFAAIVLGFFTPLILWGAIAPRLNSVLTVLGHIQTMVIALIVLWLLNMIPAPPILLVPVVFLAFLYVGTIFWVYTSPRLAFPSEGRYWEEMPDRSDEPRTDDEGAAAQTDPERTAVVDGSQWGAWGAERSGFSLAKPGRPYLARRSVWAWDATGAAPRALSHSIAP